MTNPYKGIERYIDPTKIDAEFVPDIEEEDEGKILSVVDGESKWVSKGDLGGSIPGPSDPIEDLEEIKKEIAGIIIEIGKVSAGLEDKVSNGDFEGAIQEINRLETTITLLSGRIDLAMEEARILGAYIPGNNNIPTTIWSNIVYPIDYAVLNGFLFMQDSGWISSDNSHRLMFSGGQFLECANLTGSTNSAQNFCIDAYITMYRNEYCTLCDGIYLSDASGYISVNIGSFNIATFKRPPIGTPFHIAFNICEPLSLYQIYLNGEKLDLNVNEGNFSIPETLKFFEHFKGEVLSFRMYKKALTEKEILKNYEAGYSSVFTYTYLVSCFEASKAETIYADFEIVKASITLLKDEIKLQASRLEGMSHLTAGFKKVRYMRFYQSGSDVSPVNSRWSAVECYDDKDDNILRGMIATSSMFLSNPEYITDASKSTYGYINHNEGDNAYIEFDFEKIRDDVMYLKLFHYYLDKRTCKKVSVLISEDKNKWITVFNSEFSGEYQEKEDGFLIPINLGSYLDRFNYRLSSAELKITPEAITSTVINSSVYQEQSKKEIDEAINKYKVTVDKEFEDVYNATKDLENTMNGAFKDGIIDEVEAKAIKERLARIEKEKQDIYKEFVVVSSNENLPAMMVEQLSIYWNNYSGRYEDLKSAILIGIDDGFIYQDEIEEINLKTIAYNGASASFREYFTKCIDAIGTNKVAAIDSKYEKWCSTIEQTASSITSRVEHLEPLVDENTNRITVAEQKITPDAITLTVMQSTEFNETINGIKNNMLHDVEIISVNGNIFKNGVIDTILIAVVKKGSDDITNITPEDRFIWTRSSEDKEEDEIWNKKYIGGRKNIHITHNDVKNKATFTCQILDKEVK